MRKSVCQFLALASLVWLSAAAAKEREYRLDPDAAEQELAQLANRPRLFDQEWLKLLQGRENQTHKVKRGENLWNISRKLFGTGFLWRKIWEENPFLTNPHEISKGMELRYFSPNRGIASEDAPPVIKLERVKLIPDKKGNITDLDAGTRFNYDLKNRFVPSLFILPDEKSYLGEVTGSYGVREGLAFHEPIWIRADSPEIAVDKEFDIVHFEKELRDVTQTGMPFIGNVVRTVGRVRITDQGEKLFRGDLKSVRAVVNRGDKLIPVQDPVEWSIFNDPPNELQAQVVMGEDPEYKVFRQGQLVMLNKGTNDGMKPGFIFRVFREVDGLKGTAKNVEPESKGEVRVVYAGPLSAVGVIMKNFEPIEIGDTVIPRQAFVNPPPSPRRELENVNIE